MYIQHANKPAEINIHRSPRLFEQTEENFQVWPKITFTNIHHKDADKQLVEQLVINSDYDYYRL